MDTEARQVFDLPPMAPEVIEHRVQRRRCRCGTLSVASFVNGHAIMHRCGQIIAR
ncbi:IS66 family transposase zinc-finger binding domain-containing protein [Ferrimicrobium acidiphilum]|uniref:IS66 family transposase zinc-finger binding domain-containing protein n=1 Tax=Ferrimicrobium acidiphilum TaxID=121039 RepID=A0ABV3Y6N3_9ACTN